MSYQKKKLDNGLRILAVPMKDNPTATVMVLVEAGSHYETKEINGLSHFLEHMMFKGTKNRPSVGEIAHELDALGSSSNAFTGHEYTGYYAKSRPDNLVKILDIVVDLYLNPLLPEEEIDKERGVIVEEINMYEDQPSRNVWHVLDACMYGEQPAGRPILGPKENIRSFTHQDFVHYRDKHYSAPATTVVVAGDINPDDIFQKVENLFSGTPVKEVATKPPVDDKQKDVRIKIKNKDSDQSHFVLGFHSFPISDNRAPATDVLATTLGRGMSSRLFHILREKMGVCYYVRANAHELSDHGKFTVASGVDTKRVEEVIAEILKQLKLLKNKKIKKGELDKAKEYAIGNMLMGLESSDSQAVFYGTQEIIHEDIETIDDVVKKIKAVTAEDVQGVAQDIFKSENLNLAIVGPHKNEEAFKDILTL